MRQEKKLINPSFPAIMFEVEDLQEQGWKLNREEYPVMVGFGYEVTLYRDATVEQMDLDAAEAAKPSRAEILAKARAAKAEKKQGGN